ncbi:MAG: histidine--tRNA ligase [Dehalococcoidia bacterium]|nr:histidine--tRNA ligase [Dehalococcoidia bacterium]
MYKAPRGTSDILPEEQGYFRYIEERAAELCRLYGYERIDTPVFEDARLFIRTIGPGTDIVEKETYSFEDRSGQAMTLRPEGTAPICRAYLEHGMHNLPQPVRLYYIASIFRYERPQKGRYRQHQQFGFEALGDADPALDAEVIDMAWRFFDRIGLSHLCLQLNSIGCKLCRPHYLEELKVHYSAYGDRLCPDCKARLLRNPLRLLDCKKPSCQGVAQSAPRSVDYLCPECGEHFESVLRYLFLLGIPFEKNHRLVRGLDYYTRTVFEIQPKGEAGAQSALGGGGRYDDLIEELGGRPTPAIGFAAGMERIVLNMKEQGVSPPAPSGSKVFVAYFGDEAKDEAVRLIATLRRTGISAFSSFGDRSLKAQLRQADALGASYCLILSEEEVKTGTAMLRDMAKGEQRRVSMGDVVGQLQKENH